MKQKGSKENLPGGVFLMELLFKNPVELPEQPAMLAVMKKHLGDVELFFSKKGSVGFCAKEYISTFKDGKLPAQLMVAEADMNKQTLFDEFTKSQMWDCREQRDEILEQCRYCLCATDLMAAGMPAQQRAELDMNFLEAMLELFPDCQAVYFQSSGKLLTTEFIRENLTPKEERFVHFGVNVRFFNVENSEDMVVDTKGMSLLFLPDMQYHFHSMDPNWVVGHAYSMASYLFHNDNPIKDGDTIDGVANGHLDPLVQWQCRYEVSLVEPQREVIDVNMNEYAAGNRENDQ